MVKLRRRTSVCARSAEECRGPATNAVAGRERFGNQANSPRGGGAIGCSARASPCHSGISNFHEVPSDLTNVTNDGMTNVAWLSTSIFCAGCGSVLLDRATSLQSEHGCLPSKVFVTADMMLPPREYDTSIRVHASDWSTIQCPPAAAKSTKSISTWPNRSRVGGMRWVLQARRWRCQSPYAGKRKFKGKAPRRTVIPNFRFSISPFPSSIPRPNAPVFS